MSAGERIKKILFVTALLVLVALAATAGLWPDCVLLRWLHIPCLTCGMTRSFLALLHGDWRTSLHYHPLTVPFALTIWLLFAREPLGISERALHHWVVALGAMLVFFWLFRIMQGPQEWAFLLS